MVEVLGCYSNRASFKIDKINIISDALARIDYRLTDRFTAEELDQLVTRYKAGETSTALARQSGIAKSTFLRLLAERGVGTRPRGLTPAKEGEILRLRKQGMIIREIAKRVGCSYDVARIFLLNHK